ncbi:hypothetical protein IFM89_010804 [Coptis chinensis]|uniref:Uncharacterized protein n=1 Tax=Coptis chinensis TaxID=261450 RepID=A0A835ILQ8_9MAGN|nr:hypothetical protein IFM89_010804 [Coptis chinensis]
MVKCRRVINFCLGPFANTEKFISSRF